MPSFKTLPWALLFLVFSALPARADGFITPFVGYNYGGDTSNCESLTSCEDHRMNWGVSIGSIGKLMGYEQDIGYAKHFFGKAPGVDNSVFTLMSNMLVGVGSGPVQPYFLFGFGLIRAHATLNTTIVAEASKYSLGYDIGGGVSGYFSRHVGIRGDLRRFQTTSDVPVLSTGGGFVGLTNQKLDFWRASIGVALR